ncbi:MAG: septum site-determining protein MinC [Gemmatimonadetes bacterium]|nr:MAG: septum site-determining protein MinC [Gemmatimonadota bacterium]
MTDKMSIAFRGTPAGLVVVVDEEKPFKTIMADLVRKLEDSGYFFVGADVTLDLGSRDLDRTELNQVAETIQNKHGLVITGVKTTSERTKSAAQALDVNIVHEDHPAPNASAKTEIAPPTHATPPVPEYPPTLSPIPPGELPTEIVRRTFRSGQQYESAGNLVVLGDVNAGAELIAAGDIIIFGALRGMAFAGSTGKTDAMILALKLNPTQLRIADRVARSAGDVVENNPGPEVAFIENDQIVIDVWGKH